MSLRLKANAVVNNFCLQNCVVLLLGFILSIVPSSVFAAEVFQACTDVPATDLRNAVAQQITTKATHCSKETALDDIARFVREYDTQKLAIDGFYDQGADEVIHELNIARATFTAMEKCASQKPRSAECAKNLNDVREKIRRAWPEFIATLSLSQPTNHAPHARNSKASWYGSKPRNPGVPSAAIAPLSPEGAAFVENTFLNKLGEKVPSVAARRAAEGKNFQLLALDKKSEVYVDQAMVQIRDEAAAHYYALLEDNPLLVFFSDIEIDPKKESYKNSPTDEQLATAAAQMEAAFSRRISLLKSDPKHPDRQKGAHRALLDHKAIMEKILSKNKHLCGAATQAYKDAQQEKARHRLGIAVTQAAAAVFTIVKCTRKFGFGCLGGSTALAGADFGIHHARANEAFELGLIHAATPGVGLASDSPFRLSVEERRRAILAPGFARRTTAAEILMAFKASFNLYRATQPDEEITCEPGYRALRTPRGRTFTCIREKRTLVGSDSIPKN